MYLVRDQTKQPFAASSPWNTPLGIDAAYQVGTDAETALYRNANAGGHAMAFPWIGGHAMAVFQAKASDPLATWTYKSRPGTMPAGILGPPTGGSFQMRTPANIKFMGNDQWGIVIDPTGRFAIEVWQGWASGGAYGCSYAAQTDLFGSGFSVTPGMSEGIRAAGCSLLGGLLRAEELAAYDINHAIALALSQTQISPKGIMAPATYTDGGGSNNHSGIIPMGARFAVPPGVALSGIGLRTPEGFALARAFQRFGGIVVDTATNTNAGAGCEDSISDAQVNALQADWPSILAACCMVRSVGTGAGTTAPLPLAGQ